MKRADAFLLGLTFFVAANCISYFVLSHPLHVAAWEIRTVADANEKIGFPFVIFEGGGGFSAGGGYAWYWLGAFGDLVTAVTAGYLFSLYVTHHLPRWLRKTLFYGAPDRLSLYLAHSLPPLWAGHSRGFRYSLRGLLGTITAVLLLFGIGMCGPAWSVAVVGFVCLAGPITFYAWCSHRRQLSWTRLTAAAVGMVLLALTVDYSNRIPTLNRQGIEIAKAFLPVTDPQDEGNRFFARFDLSLTLIRLGVPVFGGLALLVIADAAFASIRQIRKRKTGKKGKSCSV
ncbi:MAG: hypothetical protein JXB10_09200 [Pirellulales bacterium]|nr:hypothetical protein [Pirellulales bacterium]